MRIEYAQLTIKTTSPVYVSAPFCADITRISENKIQYGKYIYTNDGLKYALESKLRCRECKIYIYDELIITINTYSPSYKFSIYPTPNETVNTEIDNKVAKCMDAILSLSYTHAYVEKK